MKQLPGDLASHLASGATTLCHCWRLVRRDGGVLGFTDHDLDIVFGGTTFAAHSGVELAEVDARLGFSVGGTEVAGALVSDVLNEQDLAAGRYDGASVETWLVNWSSPAQRLLLDVTTIGEVRRTDTAFAAELRSMAYKLDQDTGRLYQLTCSADLGDARCGVALATPAFTTTRPVLHTDGRITCTVDLHDFADRWFSAGSIAFTSGLNTGARVAIKEHRAASAGAVISLWTPMPATISPGDAVTLVAGCDKGLATCGAKFKNVVNFRGCAHMPGNDVVTAYASTSVVMDGGSLFK